MRSRIAAVLLFMLAFAVPALADPVYLHRQPVIWRESQAALFGAYADSGVFTRAQGTPVSSVVDTSKAIFTGCIRPKPDANALPGVAADSLLWLRFVLVPSEGISHGMAVAPTITIQSLQTPHTGAAAVLNGTATAMTQGVTAYTVADTSWSKAYSNGTVAALTGGSAAPYVRVIVTGTLTGQYRGYIEYWTSCPQITNGGQP